ncbi:hypothetical protein B0H19DRAFT_1256134 [Mycena capillaripes]|nr:hypothetical protein B0H19DRAFT_1256134 [Mycena capillaripes]
MESAVSFNVNTTIGALQIGVLVSYVLFGVITTQTYVYYTRFPEDSGKLKALVGFVWAHPLRVHDIQLSYTNPERIFGVVPKSLDAAIFFYGVISACVQGFFTFRIYAFSKPLYIPILCLTMALFPLLGNTVIFVGALKITSSARAELQRGWFFTSTWCIAAANDLIITATLVILLLRQRPNAHRRTEALMDKLIVWTIETGMLTSASSIVILACFLTMKLNFIWVGLAAVAPRVFSNSLLASLNSRATLRAMNEVSLTPGIGLASINIQMTKSTEIACDIDAVRVQCDKGASEDV